MATKIQINSLAALNRLIGDDEELEIEVRKSVIEAFGKGFVKSVANNKDISVVIKEMYDQTYNKSVEEAEKFLGVTSTRQSNSDGRVVTLPKEIKAEIRSVIREEYEILLWEAVRKYKKDVEEDVAVRANKMLEKYVASAVQKYMSEKSDTLATIRDLVDNLEK